ncbi:MAG: peptide chain release factor N(5)-glutamine methyltransferase [Clostridiales bacterium]|nr:peptide chain release factor N(5)-glutamine methyltransferase [Clostridiales bacterium]
MNPKLSEAYSYGKSILKANNIESYMLDARLILAYVAGVDSLYVITGPDMVLDEGMFEKYKLLINERSRHKPVQYLINKCEFMGNGFYVDENTLIPRPDTEILVERCVKYLHTGKYKKILELGTGSGCIIISLAKLFDFDFTAVDISGAALSVAKKNAFINNVSNKVKFVESDLMSGLGGEKFDIIISNPPYIESAEINRLSQNVKGFEPILALDGGADGLCFYKNILFNAKNYLNFGGLIMFEIGFNQANALRGLFQKYNIVFLELIKDYQGLDRVVVGQYR